MIFCAKLSNADYFWRFGRSFGRSFCYRKPYRGFIRDFLTFFSVTFPVRKNPVKIRNSENDNNFLMILLCDARIVRLPSPPPKLTSANGIGLNIKENCGHRYIAMRCHFAINFNDWPKNHPFFTGSLKLMPQRSNPLRQFFLDVALGKVALFFQKVFTSFDLQFFL